MKLSLMHKATRATLFAAALLAISLFAGSVKAQSLFEGKFTLQYETRWGQTVLPAGQYLVTFDSNISNLLVITDAKSHRTLAYEPTGKRDGRTEGKSALLVGTRGSQRVVHSFRVAELGQTFIYDRALTREEGPRQEARQSQTVPVVVAKK
ncbi:MAG: hypothetical protein ACRD3B_05810 [Candidatus Sulfotelmatobacter sp.]